MFDIFHILLILLSAALVIMIIILNRQLKRLERKELIISSIKAVSEKVPEMGHRIEFLKLICSTLKDITGAQEFVYFVYNSNLQKLIPAYTESPYAKEIMNTTLNLGEGFSGKVAASGKPGMLNYTDEKKGSKYVLGTPTEKNSLLAVPIIFNGSLLGVILQAKYGNKVFTNEDLRLSEIFTNIVSSFLYTKNLLYELRNSVVQLIISFIKNVEYKDAYTAGHSIRVGHFAEIIARRMRLSEREVMIVKIGGFLHDLGKISVDDSILKEDKKLSEEDWKKIKMHPQIGAEMISKFGFLQDVVPCIWFHHKHYDGSGYPDFPIKGKDIPICGRIVAVADAIDAITTTRPGYPARSLNWAIEELRRKSGAQFDPDVVEAAAKGRAEIEKYIRKKFDIEDEANYKDFEKIF